MPHAAVKVTVALVVVVVGREGGREGEVRDIMPGAKSIMVVGGASNTVEGKQKQTWDRISQCPTRPRQQGREYIWQRQLTLKVSVANKRSQSAKWAHVSGQGFNTGKQIGSLTRIARGAQAFDVIFAAVLSATRSAGLKLFAWSCTLRLQRRVTEPATWAELGAASLFASC